MKKIYCVSVLLVFVGALNWGLIGLLKFNLVTWVFDLIGNPNNDFMVLLQRIIYTAVGVAGVLLLLGHCKACKKDPCDTPS